MPSGRNAANEDPIRPGQEEPCCTLPEWPQPQGVFTKGTHFHPVVFLAKIRGIYEKVVVDRESGEALLEHEAFASLLVKRTIVVEDGSVLFKLYDLSIGPLTPDGLIVSREGCKYLRIDCLREPSEPSNESLT